MGRHSASDDDGDDAALAVEGPALDLAPRVRGRHSSGDDEQRDERPDDQPTQMITVVDPGLLGSEQAHDAVVTGEFRTITSPPVVAPEEPSGDDGAAERKAAEKAAADERKAAEKAAADERKAAEKAAADERKAAEKAAADERKAAEKAAADERKAAEKATADAQKADKQAAKAQKKAARGETDTQADLRLLRTSNAVRAQCIAAVVVAFGLYTLVMAVIGRMSDYALFVWVPIVVSGILIGVVLDLAHRREKPAPSDDAAPGPSVEPTGEAPPEQTAVDLQKPTDTV